MNSSSSSTAPPPPPPPNVFEQLVAKQHWTYIYIWDDKFVKIKKTEHLLEWLRLCSLSGIHHGTEQFNGFLRIFYFSRREIELVGSKCAPHLCARACINSRSINQLSRSLANRSTFRLRTILEDLAFHTDGILKYVIQRKQKKLTEILNRLKEY